MLKLWNISVAVKDVFMVAYSEILLGLISYINAGWGLFILFFKAITLISKHGLIDKWINISTVRYNIGDYQLGIS